MDISLINSAIAREAIESIAECNQQLVDNNDLLKRCLNKIVENWESNGLDKQDYVKELEKQLSNIENLSSVLSNFIPIVNRHIEEMEEISSNSVGQ